MKKQNFLNYWMVLLLTAVVTIFASCKDDKNDDSNVPDDPNKEKPIDNDGYIVLSELGNGDAEFELLSDKDGNNHYILKKGVYSLRGFVYVTNGVELTIEAGTVIKGDKETKGTLIVEPGGKVHATGTATAPIVFTSAQPKGSRKPGDWGGVIICGRATNNKGAQIIEGGPRTTHGGTNDGDNSGEFQYVRIEFCGYPFKPDQEINGLTMGSVGSGTKIDHVQVSYSNDDSFEWFGGAVNCKYLVAYHGWDDDFDTDNGFSGKLQFLLGVRHPKIGDTSLSNGFESDNNSDGSTATPITTCVFSNVTLVGPIGQDPSFVNDANYITAGNLNPNNGSKVGLFQAAMHIRRNSNLSCYNSVAIGYPVGLILDNEKGDTQGAAKDGKLTLKDLYFAGMGVLGSDVNKSWKDQLSTNGKDEDGTKPSFSSTFFTDKGNHNYNAIADLKLKQPNSMTANQNYGPSAGSPLINAALTVPAAFDAAGNGYAGAFKSDADADNWTKGWCNFDPQNTDY